MTQIIGQSPWTRQLCQSILRVAPFPSSVLISGPSGTGKELIARAIHERSPRREQAFVPVDCTSLSGELFASHLFGHVKGAFTGADHERLGCFRAADGGTILLDEIGELSPDLQSKLLRVIQERVVVPLGSDQPIRVDVRVLAATNRDLAHAVDEGRFRLDLFYRLNVVNIVTESLAQRRDDIVPLAAHFLTRLAEDHGYPFKRLSDAAVEVLRSYSWPGNVRQLQNALERAAVYAPGEVIDAQALPQEIVSAESPARCERLLPEADADLPRWPSLTDVEREHIRATLERTAHNQSAAAALLNINRATLARKIGEYQLSLGKVRRGRPRRSTV